MKGESRYDHVFSDGNVLHMLLQLGQKLLEVVIGRRNRQVEGEEPGISQP